MSRTRISSNISTKELPRISTMIPAATLRRHGHDNRHRQQRTEKSRPPIVAASSSSSSSSSSTPCVVESPAATAAAAAAFLPQPAPPRHGRSVVPPQQQQQQQGIVNASHPKHRLTYAIQQMKEVCPHHIATYASCVLSYNGTVTTMDVPVGGGSETKYLMKQSFCSEEFRQVKDCFRQLRG